jgi:Fe-S oxidoreductase
MHKITRLLLHREVSDELLPRIEKDACFVCGACISQCSYLQRVPFLRVEEALMEHRSHSFSLIEKQAWVK